MTVYEIKPCNSRGSVGYETFDPKKPVKTDLPPFSLGYFWNHWKYTVAAHINHIAYITLWSVHLLIDKKRVGHFWQSFWLQSHAFPSNQTKVLLGFEVLQVLHITGGYRHPTHALGASSSLNYALVAGVRHADNCIISLPLWLKPFSPTNQGVYSAKFHAWTISEPHLLLQGRPRCHLQLILKTNYQSFILALGHLYIMSHIFTPRAHAWRS